MFYNFPESVLLTMWINALQLETLGICCINIRSQRNSYTAACSTHGRK